MSDEPLKPAVLEPEWRRAAIHAMAQDDGRLTMVSVAWLAERFEAVVALGNSALPDDSPYKITRGDVADLNTAATLLEDLKYFASGRPTELRRLAAKLAALLPPSGDTP